MIRVISPKVMADDCDKFQIEGWGTALFSSDVHISFANGKELPITVSDPEIRESLILGRKTVLFSCPVDLSNLQPLPEWTEHGVSIAIDIQIGGELGRIEYQVSPQWILRRFGPDCRLRPRIFPPEHLQLRVAGEVGVSFTSFSEIAVRQIVQRISAAGRNISNIESILDFGCGSARVARTFKDLYPHLRLIGTDIDSEAIEWCKQNVGDVGQFCVNDILPPLPLDDESVDMVYTISTFTHMPEAFQFAWLLELRRVLKPGGYLLATVHGPEMVDYIAHLYPGASDLKNEVHDLGFVYVGEPREGWPSYFGAQTDGLPSFYKLSYHSHSYIFERWSEFFDIVSVGNMDLNIFQDAIVARKPAGVQGSYDRVLALSLNEKAARFALEDAFRVASVQRANIQQLNQRVAELESALGEAQLLAHKRLSEIEILTRRLAASGLTLAERLRLATKKRWL